MKIQKAKKLLRSGFTLIELLVVIAVLGVLAAAIIAAIDPVEKIRQANDSRVKGDVNAIAKALEIYAAQNDGVYPASQAVLLAKSDLKQWPKSPSAEYGTTGPTLTTYTGGVIIGSPMKSKANLNGGSTMFWVYDTGNARACAMTTLPTAKTLCP